MRKVRMTDEQLTESIRTVGVLVPGLKWHGVLVDGRRRSRICAALGIRFPFRDVQAFGDVVRALWELEPERCVKRFGESRGPEAFAQLVGLRRGQVAAYFKRSPGVKSETSDKSDAVNFRVPAALHEQVIAFAEQNGLSVSEVLRGALQKQVRSQRALKGWAERRRRSAD
jgi:hypothetical protein